MHRSGVLPAKPNDFGTPLFNSKPLPHDVELQRPTYSGLRQSTFLLLLDAQDRIYVVDLDLRQDILRHGIKTIDRPAVVIRTFRSCAKGVHSVVCHEAVAQRIENLVARFPKLSATKRTKLFWSEDTA